MSNPLRLSDVFLSPNAGHVEPHRVVKPFDPMDTMEYGLGLERGWLIDLLSRASEYSDLIWDDMNSEVYENLMRHRIALLPEPDVVAKVGKLFRRNFLDCPMKERTQFLEVLPFMEYTYTLLPVCDPVQLPIYVKDLDAQPIFEPLTIRTKIHPCFLLVKTACYGAMYHPKTRCVLDDETFRRVAWASIDGFGLVPMSWLGDDSPKYNNRPLVFAKQDLPPPIFGVNQTVKMQEANLTASKEKMKLEKLKTVDKTNNDAPRQIQASASSAKVEAPSYEDIGVGMGVVDMAWLSDTINL